jgi:hypothetical protein
MVSAFPSRLLPSNEESYPDCGFDELGSPANRIQVNQAGPTGYQDQVGGLRSRKRLRACGWRRVDNGNGETMCRSGRKPMRQSAHKPYFKLVRKCPNWRDRNSSVHVPTNRWFWAIN